MDTVSEVSYYEEWAVRSGDGEISRVADRASAEREAKLLQAEEPDAAAAHRYVIQTPDGATATGWQWTVGRTP